MKNKPPLTCPFVQIADIDNVVIVVTTAARRTISDISPIPACPVSHGSLRYKITPQIFKRQGTRTPLHQPNFNLGSGREALTSVSIPWLDASIGASSWQETNLYHLMNNLQKANRHAVCRECNCTHEIFLSDFGVHSDFEMDFLCFKNNRMTDFTSKRTLFVEKQKISPITICCKFKTKFLFIVRPLQHTLYILHSSYLNQRTVGLVSEN